MKAIKFYPYSMGSEGLYFLKDELESRGLDVKLIKKRGSLYTGNKNDVVVNWGNSNPVGWKSKVSGFYNDPNNIKHATNKLSFFKILNSKFSSNIPEFTTSKSVAKEWTKNSLVFCRQSLTGSQGKGIVVADAPGEVVDAPLYTKGIKSDIEYRVHVFNGKVIDIVRKFYFGKDRKSEIRNLENGWTFIRKGVNRTAELDRLSVGVCKALGLDFCALDLIVKDDKFYFLEANTAPGMTGTTVINYANAVESLVIDTVQRKPWSV